MNPVGSSDEHVPLAVSCRRVAKVAGVTGFVQAVAWLVAHSVFLWACVNEQHLVSVDVFLKNGATKTRLQNVSIAYVILSWAWVVSCSALLYYSVLSQKPDQEVRTQWCLKFWYVVWSLVTYGVCVVDIIAASILVSKSPFPVNDTTSDFGHRQRSTEHGATKWNLFLYANLWFLRGFVLWFWNFFLAGVLLFSTCREAYSISSLVRARSREMAKIGSAGKADDVRDIEVEEMKNAYGSTTLEPCVERSSSPKTTKKRHSSRVRSVRNRRCVSKRFVNKSRGKTTNLERGKKRLMNFEDESPANFGGGEAWNRFRGGASNIGTGAKSRLRCYVDKMKKQFDVRNKWKKSQSSIKTLFKGPARGFCVPVPKPSVITPSGVETSSSGKSKRKRGHNVYVYYDRRSKKKWRFYDVFKKKTKLSVEHEMPRSSSCSSCAVPEATYVRPYAKIQSKRETFDGERHFDAAAFDWRRYYDVIDFDSLTTSYQTYMNYGSSPHAGARRRSPSEQSHRSFVVLENPRCLIRRNGQRPNDGQIERPNREECERASAGSERRALFIMEGIYICPDVQMSPSPRRIHRPGRDSTPRCCGRHAKRNSYCCPKNPPRSAEEASDEASDSRRSSTVRFDLSASSSFVSNESGSSSIVVAVASPATSSVSGPPNCCADGSASSQTSFSLDEKKCPKCHYNIEFCRCRLQEKMPKCPRCKKPMEKCLCRRSKAKDASGKRGTMCCGCGHNSKRCTCGLQRRDVPMVAPPRSAAGASIYESKQNRGRWIREGDYEKPKMRRMWNLYPRIKNPDGTTLLLLHCNCNRMGGGRDKSRECHEGMKFEKVSKKKAQSRAAVVGTVPNQFTAFFKSDPQSSSHFVIQCDKKYNSDDCVKDKDQASPCSNKKDCAVEARSSRLLCDYHMNFCSCNRSKHSNNTQPKQYYNHLINTPKTSNAKIPQQSKNEKCGGNIYKKDTSKKESTVMCATLGDMVKNYEQGNEPKSDGCSQTEPKKDIKRIESGDYFECITSSKRSLPCRCRMPRKLGLKKRSTNVKKSEGGSASGKGDVCECPFCGKTFPQSQKKERPPQKHTKNSSPSIRSSCSSCKQKRSKSHSKKGDGSPKSAKKLQLYVTEPGTKKKLKCYECKLDSFHEKDAKSCNDICSNAIELHITKPASGTKTATHAHKTKKKKCWRSKCCRCRKSKKTSTHSMKKQCSHSPKKKRSHTTKKTRARSGCGLWAGFDLVRKMVCKCCQQESNRCHCSNSEVDVERTLVCRNCHLEAKSCDCVPNRHLRAGQHICSKILDAMTRERTAFQARPVHLLDSYSLLPNATSDLDVRPVRDTGLKREREWRTAPTTATTTPVASSFESDEEDHTVIDIPKTLESAKNQSILRTAASGCPSGVVNPRSKLGTIQGTIGSGRKVECTEIYVPEDCLPDELKKKTLADRFFSMFDKN